MANSKSDSKSKWGSSKASPLKKIKSGVFSRGIALAKVSALAGAKVAAHTARGFFAEEGTQGERLKALLISQIEALSIELGQLKGSLMKVGQLLSMHGEHFLPPEANAFLKTLQSQSPPLEWKAIEKVLLEQLGRERLDGLEIEHEAVASASLGQVHRAKRKSDGKLLALKIQYPGVDRAIEGDLKALRTILSVSKLIPKGPKYEDLFQEVRSMLEQEVDYLQEMKATQEYRSALLSEAGAGETAGNSNPSAYIIPEIIEELCTGKVLTTTYEEGCALDSNEVLSLSQERRNQIGMSLFKLYFRELFEFRAVQTDPHLGNYRVRLGAVGHPDRLILYDFGAVRKLAPAFLDPYSEMLRGCVQRDSELILGGASRLGFIQGEDPLELKQGFVELCFMISEPLYTAETPGVRKDLFEPDGTYRWGDSDLSKRVANKGAELAFAFRLRPPPQEVLFLDRKMGGIFVLLSVLKVKIRGRDALPQVGILSNLGWT